MSAFWEHISMSDQDITFIVESKENDNGFTYLIHLKPCQKREGKRTGAPYAKRSLRR